MFISSYFPDFVGELMKVSLFLFCSDFNPVARTFVIAI